MSDGALSGFKVVDLAGQMPGQVTSMILADLGAEVVKIERPQGGDFSRSALPGTYEAVNRNKRCIALDLKDDRGQDALLRLTRNADVFIESFRPGVAQRLGAGFDKLSEANHDLVYCSLSGYGQTGPYVNEPGHDPNFLGVAGVLSLAGDPWGPPSDRVGVSIADLSGAWFATIAILAALMARHRVGGQYIDLSLTDAAYASIQSRLCEFAANDEAGKDTLMSRPGVGIFQTRDRKYISIGAAEDHFWRALIELLGLDSDWVESPKFASNGERARHGAEIQEVLSRAFELRDRDEWIGALKAAGIPVAHVNDLSSAINDPQARDRQIVEWLEHPTMSRLLQVRFPALLSKTPASIRERPPLLGEHSEEILMELGYSAREIGELASAGVTRWPSGPDA